jgi:quercetin dioxygenase-like cupin family protein
MTLIRTHEEGDLLWFNQSLLTFKALSEETGGAFLLFEMLSPRGKATPLHVHPDEDESFYVLDGELLAYVEGRELAAPAGSFFSFPRGTEHAFTVTSETARFLTLFTPGGPATEAFFRDAGEPAPRAELPPDGPADIPRIAASAEQNGSVRLLGPPPFATAGVAG